jgi:hypothetical protein
MDTRLNTHEWIFYIFDSLPMLPAILVFCVWHPAKFFNGVKGVDDLQLESSYGIADVTSE